MYSTLKYHPGCLNTSTFPDCFGPCQLVLSEMLPSQFVRQPVAAARSKKQQGCDCTKFVFCTLSSPPLLLQQALHLQTPRYALAPSPRHAVRNFGFMAQNRHFDFTPNFSPTGCAPVSLCCHCTALALILLIPVNLNLLCFQSHDHPTQLFALLQSYI